MRLIYAISTAGAAWSCASAALLPKREAGFASSCEKKNWSTMGVQMAGGLAALAGGLLMGGQPIYTPRNLTAKSRQIPTYLYTGCNYCTRCN
ncbi:hypothetical protein GGR57DRAFT_439576 [Xylariaceae sp. FL1272]|nr:hypothetical protein GGR57DRAFT_439576 [Xylariaceae sp. FL1272]